MTETVWLPAAHKSSPPLYPKVRRSEESQENNALYLNSECPRNHKTWWHKYFIGLYEQFHTDAPTGQNNSPKKSWQTYLGQESVDKDGFNLTKAVDPKDTLDVIGGIPGGVEDDDPVSCHKVDAKGASASWNEEQTTSTSIRVGEREKERVYKEIYNPGLYMSNITLTGRCPMKPFKYSELFGNFDLEINNNIFHHFWHLHIDQRSSQ